MQKWIGLFEVKPIRGNDVLRKARGAYVNVIGLASDAEHFREIAVLALAQQEFEVVVVEDIRTVNEWLMHDDPAAEMISLAQTVTSQSPVALGSFYTWKR